MKRFLYLLVPMVLSSSAYAGDAVSFVIGGHRIHIEAASHCNSPSCVSVSIPGIYETRRWRDRDDVTDATPVTPAKPLAAASTPVVASPVVAPASRPSIEPVTAPPAPKPALATAPAAPACPPIAAPVPAIAQPPKAPPAAAAPPAPAVARVVRVSQEADDEPATPVGDWRTEGNEGSVRIEPCGRALCGYLLNSSSKAKTESVLVNMKPKAVSEWSGNVYSRDSGQTYYGAMIMKGPNSLRVEACALGRFFCSGNLWTRIVAQPEKLMTAGQVSSAPRS
jgi:uncharacterized protein (DUF2147 family)